MKTFLLVVVLLVVPSLAQAEDHPRDRLSVANFAAGVASVGLASADAWITYRAVSRGEAEEANPWLVPHVKAHGIGPTMAAKLAINVGTEIGFHYIERRWPNSKKALLGARLATIAVNGYAVAHNLRVLRGGR